MVTLHFSIVYCIVCCIGTVFFGVVSAVDRSSIVTELMWTRSDTCTVVLKN